MHLLSALAAGIRGAENGYAEVRRLNGALATCYADINGTTLTQGSSGLTLDANGSIIAYVGELAEIIVRDSSGTELRRFHDIVGDSAVEIRSVSFTGTEYDASSQGLTKPLSLNLALSRVIESFGTDDWDVLFDGSATRLQDALGAFAGLFISVKSPAYGAEGDGVSDDTTAIQNAINAAALLKATVLFPPGIYRTTAKLTVPLGVSLQGTGPEGCAIRLDHATADILEYGSGAGLALQYQDIRGLRLYNQQLNTGRCVYLTAAAARYVSITGCLLGGGTETAGDLVFLEATTHVMEITNSTLTTAGGSKACLNADRYGPIVRAQGTTFTTSAAAYNSDLVAANQFWAHQCRFWLGDVTSGTMSCVRLNGNGAGSGPVGSITDSEFQLSGGTESAIKLANADETSTSVYEYGNVFRGGVAAWNAVYDGWGVGTTAVPALFQGSRPGLQRALASNVTPLALDPQYGQITIQRSTNAAQVITMVAGPAGARLTIAYHNDSASNIAAGDITFTTGFYVAFALPAIAASSCVIFQVVSVRMNGKLLWVPVPYVTSGGFLSLTVFAE